MKSFDGGYTVSSVKSNESGHYGLGLRDGICKGSKSVWGSELKSGQWIEADLSSLVTIVSTKITDRIDWGVAYLNGAALEFSVDGINWTTSHILNNHKTGIPKTYIIGSQARYIRIKSANKGLGIGNWTIEHTSDYILEAKFHAYLIPRSTSYKYTPPIINMKVTVPIITNLFKYSMPKAKYVTGVSMYADTGLYILPPAVSMVARQRLFNIRHSRRPPL